MTNHPEHSHQKLPVRNCGGSEAKGRGNRNLVRLFSKNWRKRAQKSTAKIVAVGLFRLMKSKATAPVFQRVPKSVCVRLANFLSGRDYHAQALTLSPNPLGETSLKAGIHTHFNKRHRAFSDRFTLAQGIAWLGFNHESIPHGKILAKWVSQLPENVKDRSLAFLCQIGFEDFEILLPSISPPRPPPRWLSDRLVPASNSGSVIYADLNQNLLTFNQLKRAGHDQEATTVLVEAFTHLDLPPPPARLFNGYSPARPAPAFAGKSKLPKISIILCAWNAAEFLPVALASILGQTYPNLEIIAIDDGSTDGTLDVLEHWLRDWPGAVIIHQVENCGTYACRNEGLACATGQYVTFHDADDWSCPEKIERQWKAIAGARNALASSSDWFRMDFRTGLCFTRRVFPLCRWNCSSFMFHRIATLETLGFYDSVATGADSEYVARFEAVLGPQRHIRVRLPLSIGLEHESSLTRVAGYGFDERGLSHKRQLYLESWRSWHAARWHLPGGLFLPLGESISGHLEQARHIRKFWDW